MLKYRVGVEAADQYSTFQIDSDYFEIEDSI